jgi:hypothetical protein
MQGDATDMRVCCSAKDALVNQMAVPTCVSFDPPTVKSPSLLATYAKCSGPGIITLHAEVDIVSDVAFLLLTGRVASLNISDVASFTALLQSSRSSLNVSILYNATIPAASMHSPASVAVCGVAEPELTAMVLACLPGSTAACSMVQSIDINVDALCTAEQHDECRLNQFLKHLQPQLQVTQGPGLLADTPMLAASADGLQLSQVCSRLRPELSELTQLIHHFEKAQGVQCKGKATCTEMF